MRRLVLIDGRLIGYRYGGIANYAAQLAALTPEFSSDLDIRLAVKKPPIHLSDRSYRVYTPPHHTLERIAFGMEVLWSRADLIHSVDYVQPISPGVSAVVTVHDLAFLSNPALVTEESRRYYLQFLESGPDASRIIAVSDYTKRQILEHTDIEPERIRVVPNGYDPNLFHTDSSGDDCILVRMHPAVAYFSGSEQPVVLAVGTIEPRKRLGLLIEAFDRHYDLIGPVSGSSPVLMIVGQVGWLSADVVERLRSLQRRGRAIWLRDVNDRELAALYRLASLLIMPSADEGFGLPVLEAMASGTPSLIANTGALPDLVADAGFIEETDVAENWAGKIGRILHDTEIRERSARRGIERASSLTWRETARQTVEVYREVLNSQ